MYVHVNTLITIIECYIIMGTRFQQASGHTIDTLFSPSCRTVLPLFPAHTKEQLIDDWFMYNYIHDNILHILHIENLTLLFHL